MATYVADELSQFQNDEYFGNDKVLCSVHVAAKLLAR